MPIWSWSGNIKWGRHELQKFSRSLSMTIGTMISKRVFFSFTILAVFQARNAHCGGKDDNCKLSSCQPVGTADLCAGTDLIETARDDCVTGKKKKAGEVALCCPAGSQEDALTTLLGVESHQFPHFARLEHAEGHKVSSCGGSIYNDMCRSNTENRFVIMFN